MREPYQVLVILYNNDKELKVCVFHRKKTNYWQFISGGKESHDRDLIDTVVREIFEETGLNIKREEVKTLETITSIPAIWFEKIKNNTILVKENCFAVYLDSFSNISLCDEHDRMLVVASKEAFNLLQWDSNKTALYELSTKLKRRLI